MSHFSIQRVGFNEAGIKNMSCLERGKLKKKCKKLTWFDAIINSPFIGCLIDVLQNLCPYFEMIGHIFFIMKLMLTICKMCPSANAS